MAERRGRRATGTRRPTAGRRTAGQGTTGRKTTEQGAKPSKRQGEARARHPASNTPAPKRPPSPRVRRRRATLRTVLIGLGLVGFLFVFVYPTSTFLHQRSEIDAGEQRIAQLDAQTQRLEAQNHQLQGDAAVERIAREQYGLVRPGETPYVIVPGASSTSTTAPASK